MVRNYGNTGTGNVSYGNDRDLLRGVLATDTSDAVRPADSCLLCERQGKPCDGFHEEVESADAVLDYETRDSITTSNQGERE